MELRRQAGLSDHELIFSFFDYSVDGLQGLSIVEAQLRLTGLEFRPFSDQILPNEYYPVFPTKG